MLTSVASRTFTLLCNRHHHLFLELFHHPQEKLRPLISSSLTSPVPCSVNKLCPTLCDSWTAAYQASLSITNSWSFLKLMSIESVMPSNHLILCHPFLMCSVLPSIRVFYNKSAVHSNAWPILGQSSGASASASASVFPMNIQG